MKQHLLIICLLFSYTALHSKTVFVKDVTALQVANKEAQPGDTIVLQNGEWNNVTIKLDCNGTKEKPILFKAQHNGKVILTGFSKLYIGGNYIIVSGLFFTNGYAGEDAVINFRTNKRQLANNCRVTNCVINDFNNAKRTDENYWVAFYGKNNRLDNSSFINKKNIGVLLAVILDDDRSRENFHSIDHNYFGVRVPLASNGGEIIRVGVSEHCQYNSNTFIEDNFFEHCDGETEIVSIKSCKNCIRNNVFKECQGSVVLRHGDFNNVENNIFLGNGKEGTGGVRIINKGQYVINNYFYKCKGVGFRSPLAIMNGIVNSPAHRYVAVTDAIIANNSFYDCSPISFCIGSDSERTVVPKNVQIFNNIFYNKKETQLYKAFDSIDGIGFKNNYATLNIAQQLPAGIIKQNISLQKFDMEGFPVVQAIAEITDSLKQAFSNREIDHASNKIGYSNLAQLKKVVFNTQTEAGAKWYINAAIKEKATVKINCKTASEIRTVLQSSKNSEIILTGSEYVFDTPIIISKDIIFSSTSKAPLKFSFKDNDAPFFVKINAGNSLSFKNISFDLSFIHSKAFVNTDTAASSHHSNFSMKNCQVANCDAIFFEAAKSSVCDSIVVENCIFSTNSKTLFKLDNEVEKKGYYNVEKFKVTNCRFASNKNQLITILRSGRDESTLGPDFTFAFNKIDNCSSEKNLPLIELNGVQISVISKNIFNNNNAGKTLIRFQDNVQAVHLFSKNTLVQSGKIETNKYVQIIN
jgi:poly(beta-D-mannuronate) lyase